MVNFRRSGSSSRRVVEWTPLRDKRRSDATSSACTQPLSVAVHTTHLNGHAWLTLSLFSFCSQKPSDGLDKQHAFRRSHCWCGCEFLSLLPAATIYATQNCNTALVPSAKAMLYLSRAELSSSSLWVSVMFPSLDRESILFKITSSISLIFLSTPRDSGPPSTVKHKHTRVRFVLRFT